MDPDLIEDVLDRTRPGWRSRREKRKSPWNLACALSALLLALLTWYAFFRAMWTVHVWIHPTHEGQLRHFWAEGISLRSFVSSFALAMPLFVPGIVVAGLLSNMLFWLIPPARRAMEGEAEGDTELSFIGSQLGLVKWGGAASVFAFAASFAGAYTLSSLR